jgi:hypothetical protein
MIAFPKIVAVIAGLLALAVFAVVVGPRAMWDALLGLVTCIESYGACPWE